MRTIIWFIYFWGYLVLLVPKMLRAKKLEAQGQLKERDAILDKELPKWAKRLMRLAGLTITVTGQENIPAEPVVFVSNHQGYFDIPLLLAYLDRPHGLVAKDTLAKLPFIHTWMQLLGCVFIDRSNARQSVTALGVAAKALQEEGRSFIIFPEGTRDRGGELLEFKHGAFRVAFKAGAPILPVCIDGTYAVMEKNGGWIKPARVHLTILPPIPTQGMSREESKAVGDRVRSLIADKIPINAL